MNEIYAEYKQRAETLEVSCVGDLNRKVVDNQAKKFIALSEGVHNMKIVEIARNIQQRIEKTRIILIAGPSASGKTTFANKLATQLEILGITPIVITVDNYCLIFGINVNSNQIFSRSERRNPKRSSHRQI